MPLINFQTWEMCELQCHFCLYKSAPKLKDGWDLDKFKIAADKLISIGIDRFDMTPSLGEITLDPTWLEKLEYIDGRVNYIQIYTHGLNIKEDHIRRILKLQSPLTLMFSLYGEDEASFKKTTGRNRFSRFLETVKLIKTFTPIPENKRIGFDIRFKKVELPLHVSNVEIKNPLWREILTLNSKGESHPVMNKWDNSNWGIDFPDLPNAKTQPPLDGACDCINVTLNPNGDAVICDICHPYDKRFNSLGNIFNDDATVLFKKLNEVIDNMNKGIFPSVCDLCTEFTCKGDAEDFYEKGWKEREKRYWDESYLK